MSVLDQPPADEQTPPGAVLRAGRERAGIALEVVAQRTMIPLSRLRALENDDYERVGVATFVTGYVRAYAKFLGMDPAPLVLALEPALPKSEFAAVQPAPSVALALQVQKRPRSLFWPTVIVMVVILGAVAFIGINTVLTPAGKPGAVIATDPVADPEEQTGSALTLPVELAPGAPPEEPLLDEAREVPGIAEDESLADTDFALTPQPLSEQTAAPAETSGQAAGAVTEAGSDTLALAFSGDCWVEVTDATGKALIARLATSGDNLQLFGQAPFEVVLGNAPVANVAFNDEPVDVSPAPGRKFKRLTVGE